MVNLNIKNSKIRTIKIKSIKKIGTVEAHNLSVRKNKNFVLANGVLTHNTDASFHSLRSVIEKYAMYCRFIFTCNYYTKIPEALRSRLRGYKFKQVPIEFAINYCKTILEKEEVPYEIKDIKFLVEHLYPDIRKIIDTLQKCSMSGTLKVTKDDVVTTEKAIVASVIEVCKYVESNNSKKMSNAISTIVPLVNSPDIEFRNLYSSLFLSKEIMAPVKIVVNKYLCNIIS